MIVANNEQIGKEMVFFSYIPHSIRKHLYSTKTDDLEEVRFRLGQPVMLYFSSGQLFLGKNGCLTSSQQNLYYCTRQDIDEGLELITSSSVYAVEEQIRRGFVTVSGGHRIGVCGSGVITNGQVSFLNDICGLNYRFAHEHIGVSDKIFPYIYSGGKVQNTLIIAPPGCGKTTMLRDIIRHISETGKKVSVVDERAEIAGMSEGYASFDLGYQTDVLECVSKDVGMIMMLRSMSPDVIVTDEIGTQKDFLALQELSRSGVAIIATIHGSNRGEVIKKHDLDCFSSFITLGRNKENGFTIEEIYS